MFVASELAELLQPDKVLISDPDYVISHVVIDSRQIVHGSESLFIAITGNRTDGHKFVRDAWALGVRNFILNAEFEVGTLEDSNVFSVADTIHALQQLAIAHRSKFHIPCIGITGSNGKTWVKEWLFQLLLADYHIVKSPRSYNSQIGVPLSVLLTDSTHNLAIFEAGVSETGEMERLAQVIRPEIGILTHLGDAHDAGFENREEKLREKCALFKNAKVVAYPAHDPFIAQRIADFCSTSHLISWGRNEDATLKVLEIISSDRSFVTYVFEGNEFELDIPFRDYASIENALTCCLVLHYLKIPQEDIARRILHLQPVKMRLEMHQLAYNCLLIDDSYSLDLESLQIGLETLGQHSHGRTKALIISDIEKQHTDDYHKIAALVQAHGVDIVYGIGDQIQRIAGFIGSDSRFALYDSVEDFVSEQAWETSKNSAFLLKGARRFEFERIVRAMRSRTHSAVLEIDLNGMLENLQFFAGKLGPATQIIAMVKASAYGSGSVEVGKFLEHNNVDRLCVAYADEGVELRQAGVSAPIMVLNPDRQNLDKLIDYRLEPEVYDLEFLRFLAKAVPVSGHQADGKSSSIRDPASGIRIGIHIKVDTGMHRLGFDPDEMGALIEALSKQAQLRVVSVFTHLAAADDPSEDTFTRAQIDRFVKCYDQIVTAIGYTPLRHVLNTYGILRFPEYQFDAVRLGIGLYGVGIDHSHHLTPVHIMKARVSQVRTINKGETVGYGRTFRAERDSIIASINAGYADGIPRRAGGGAYEMYVGNAHAPVVGRVCMDMCMLDVTDIPGVERGDEVEVFGHHASIETLARHCQTIPYEILTGISERIPRVFKFD
jgi:Alr-MurF fusion protein